MQCGVTFEPLVAYGTVRVVRMVPSDGTRASGLGWKLIRVNSHQGLLQFELARPLRGDARTGGLGCVGFGLELGLL